MAARINVKHIPFDRSKIQTSQLVNLLMQHANGTIELSQTRLKAIEILLRKSVPDLSSVDLHQQGEQIVRYYAELPRKDANPEAWSARVGPHGTGGVRVDVGVEPSETKH